MATSNTSHHKPAATPRPSTAASAMTPASFSASSPAAPASAHSTGGAGHRSHPSPAPFSSSSSSTTKAGKSPFNYLQQAHLLSSAGLGSGGGQAMSRSGTNTSSPDSNGRLGVFAGLNGMLMQAVEGGNFKTGLTPVGMGTPDAEGVSPLPSHLGIPGDGAGSTVNGSVVRQQVRDQEEERKMRLQTIVRLLGKRWGYVSRDGVERCARRVGLECLWEGRTLSIAGNQVLVEVAFVPGGDEVTGVVLGFPEREEGAWHESARNGADVLRRDLSGEENDRGYVDLEPFVKNLERLARLDRLGTGSANCFDAVEDVGLALSTVWELESNKREDKPVPLTHPGYDEDVPTDVMCEDGGKPAMHAGGRLGLSLLYWMEGRHIPGTGVDDLRLDPSVVLVGPHIRTPASWSALIECESSSADLYPPIRITADWVADAENPDQQLRAFPSVDGKDHPYIWQEPPPTFMPPGPDAMVIDANTLLPQPKLPDVRFVARLNPPVLVPLQTALNIYGSVGAPLSQETLQPTTFDSLLLPNDDGSPSAPLTERVVKREIYTPESENADGKGGQKHQYTLFTDHQAYARNIEDIPFAHPRQINALLPVLRQWAMVSSLLRRCLASTSSPSSKSDSAVNGYATSEENDDSDTDSTSSSDDENFTADNTELDRLLNPYAPSSSSSPNTRAIDISLTLTGAAPRIRLTFERRGELVDVGFCVGSNAEIADVELNMGGEEPAGDEMKQMERREKVRKVLEMSEDLGLLVEWMMRY
ncbi:MAG: hypothetical protein Q9184_005784 [Pyrenodesmia sp. 2 TL-2023]